MDLHSKTSMRLFVVLILIQSICCKTISIDCEKDIEESKRIKPIMLLTTPDSKRKVLEALPDDALILDNSESGKASDHLDRIREYVECRDSGYIIIDEIENAENFDDMMIFLSQTDEIPEIEVNDKKKSLNKFLYLFLYTDESYDEYDDIDFSYSEIKDKLLIPNWETKTSSRFNHRAFFNRLNIQILSSNDEFTFEPINIHNNDGDKRNQNNIRIIIFCSVIVIITLTFVYYVIVRRSKENTEEEEAVMTGENNKKKMITRFPERTKRVSSTKPSPCNTDDENEDIEEEEEMIKKYNILSKKSKKSTFIREKSYRKDSRKPTPTNSDDDDDEEETEKEEEILLKSNSTKKSDGVEIVGDNLKGKFKENKSNKEEIIKNRIKNDKYDFTEKKKEKDVKCFSMNKLKNKQDNNDKSNRKMKSDEEKKEKKNMNVKEKMINDKVEKQAEKNKK